MQYHDPQIRPIIDSLIILRDKSDSPLPIKKSKLHDFNLEGNILYKASFDPDGRLWRLVVPFPLVKELLKEIHETDAGHLGMEKTWKLVKSRYYWPRMYKSVFEFVRSCKTCQLYNRRNGPTPGPLQPILPPKTPFYSIGVDFVGPFPTTFPKRNSCILTVICHLTRYFEAFPCKGETTSEAISALRDQLFPKHSFPYQIIVDQGSCFVANEFKEFCKANGIKLKFCSTAHPQTNAVCERAHDVFQRSMAKKVLKNQKDWDKKVPEIVHAYNITEHRIIKMSPFYCLYGRHPRIPTDNTLPVSETYIEEDFFDSRSRAREAQKTAYIRTINAQNLSKEHFDEHHPPLNLSPGDVVCLKVTQKVKGRVQKWEPKWIGPFEVLEKIGPITYRVKDVRPHDERPLHGKSIRVVSTREMKRFYKEPHEPVNNSPYETSETEVESDFLAPSYSSFGDPNDSPVNKNLSLNSSSSSSDESVVNSHISNVKSKSNHVNRSRSSRSKSSKSLGNDSVFHSSNSTVVSQMNPRTSLVQNSPPNSLPVSIPLSKLPPSVVQNFNFSFGAAGIPQPAASSVASIINSASQSTAANPSFAPPPAISYNTPPASDLVSIADPTPPVFRRSKRTVSKPARYTPSDYTVTRRTRSDTREVRESASAYNEGDGSAESDTD